MNSNGMDILLSDGIYLFFLISFLGFLQFRMIGGIVDMWIFTGPEPEDVINQYLDVIGRPYLPPYWGFGFHQVYH